MSRVRTGHKPDDWTVNEPSSALTRHRNNNVPAETVGNMQPILSHGGNFIGAVDKRRAMTVVGRSRVA
jgi:hypothetical protein